MSLDASVAGSGRSTVWRRAVAARRLASLALALAAGGCAVNFDATTLPPARDSGLVRCRDGRMSCGAGCNSTAAEAVAYCGACGQGTACAPPSAANQVARCNAGTCEAACAEGFVRCGPMGPDAPCVALGSCDLVCPAGETRCSVAGLVRCVNLSSDILACGSCGNRCPVLMPRCVSGVCQR